MDKARFLELMEDLQSCEVASFVELKEKNNDVDFLKEKFEKENFQDPKSLYDNFLWEFIQEMDIDDDGFSWIIPPEWPNPTKKRARLEETIYQINRDIDNLRKRAERKQRKLDHLILGINDPLL